MPNPGGWTVVDIAASNPDFSTLVTALKAAGLVDTLAGKGPFTVFAPTNEAFAKLPQGTLDALLKDKAKLTSILTYHVLGGAEVLSTDLKNGEEAKTLEGDDVRVTIFGHHHPEVFINHARVIKADVKASNGVIHVLDSVLIPPSAPAPAPKPTKTIVDIAASNPEFSTLVTALKAAGL